MNNALAIYDNGRFEIMQRTAQAMVQSGYFKDSRDVAQAVTKIMAGAEIGIPPFAAMTGIHIIQGKPALGANLIATLVKNDARYNYNIVDCNDKICTIDWYENGERIGKSSFTFDEAKNAGLTGKDNWQKYTSDMLFARAITRGARRFAPGIFGGAPVYTPDELGADVDPDGYVEGEVVTDDGPNWDELESATESTDSRKETAPPEQAKRNPRQKPAAQNGNSVDWKAKAIGQPFPTFASCLINAGFGYNHERHIENKLSELGLEYDQTESEMIWSELVKAKA